MVLLSIFAFLCPPTWSHDENVDDPHLYHVIMGSCTLIVGVLKYFLILGGFVWFDSDPLGLSSCGAFVHFLLFSVRPRDCMMRMLIFYTCIRWSWDHTPWLLEYYQRIRIKTDKTPKNEKIFSYFWGFCPLWFWSFGSFVLWCFCPFFLFSVGPRDRITRMLIVYTCIMWSFDCTPWLLEY